ncbi:hypothetical protein HDU98_002240 [Podochytrium sp. JEL0797]|nr:hypothetical protein HDU98_002240 [Podochytrium sp. JEL0797]
MLTRARPTSPPRSPQIESALFPPSRSNTDDNNTTEDVLTAALMFAELGPAIGITSIGSLVTSAVSTIRDSLGKATQLRITRLHHLYNRYLSDYQPASLAIKTLLATTNTQESSSSTDALLRLVSRDEWLDRCEPKSILKSIAAEILQILFEAKPDPGSITASCIHTVALHVVDMTFFNPNNDVVYSGTRTREGDIRALSSFCMGLANSVNTGLSEKEKCILLAGGHMQRKIGTFIQVSQKLDEALAVFEAAKSVSKTQGSVHRVVEPVVLTSVSDSSELLDFEPLKRSVVASLLNLANVEVCRVFHLAITYPSTKNTFVTAVEEWDDIIKTCEASWFGGSTGNIKESDSPASSPVTSPTSTSPPSKPPTVTLSNPSSPASSPKTAFFGSRVESTASVEAARRISRLFGMIQKSLQSKTGTGALLTDAEWMSEYEFFHQLQPSNSVPPFKIVVPNSTLRLISLISNAGLVLLFAHSLLHHTERKALTQLTVIRIHLEDLLGVIVSESEMLFASIKEFRVEEMDAAFAEAAWYRAICEHADVSLVVAEKKRIVQDLMLLDALCGGAGLAVAARDVASEEGLKGAFGKLMVSFSTSFSSKKS